jgi:hypothetical protein
MGDSSTTPGPTTPVLVPVSCPDCGGVLSATIEGRGDFHVYTCQIDHRYSITTLCEAIETRVENTLLGAVVMLKQLDGLYETLLAQQGTSRETTKAQITRRLQEVRVQRAAIRALVEGTHLIELTP